MKQHLSVLLLFLFPMLGQAQAERSGLYGSAGLGYGHYILDLYDYAGGRDLYIDQRFSSFILSLGVEKKSAWSRDRLVWDIGGELTGGFGMKTDIKGTGNIAGNIDGGYLIGLNGLLKMGYVTGDRSDAWVPLVGLGPYFTYLNTGGEDALSNYIYGLQASIGVDLPVQKFLLTPELHFGVASWGSSDEMDQNGQPGLFEIKLKIAKRF